MLARLSHLLGVALIAALLSGCLNEALHEPRSYSETVSRVMVTEDGGQLAFLGERHHYLFAVPPLLAATLREPFRAAVKARLGQFEVDREGRIAGTVFLSLDADAQPEQHAAARAAGYRAIAEGTRSIASLTLEGQRYRAGPSPIPDTVSGSALREPLHVSINEPHSRAGSALRELLTPVAIVGDGLVVVGATAAALVYVPVFVVECSDKPRCWQ